MKMARQFPFSNEQVRILLYQETESNGRKLLFDSNAIQKVNLSASNTPADKSYIEISDGIGYKYVKPENDHNSIGEMVFGSVAMAYRGTALKVHWMHSPTRILCSKVFLSPIYPNQFLTTSSNDSANHTDVNSLDTSSVNSFSLSVGVSDQLHVLGCEKYHTNPLDVPHSETSDSGPSFAYSDSGYGGDGWNVSCSSYCPYSSTRSSLTSMYSDRGENSRKFSVDSSMVDSSTGRSSGNLQRRILRNVSTSFENRKSVSDCIGFIGDNSSQQTTQGGSEGYIVKARRSSEQVESRSNPEMMRRKGASGDMFRNHHSSVRSTLRRAKIGLAVCITMSESVEKEMQLFCSEHIALLESMMCRLRAAAENAWINSKRNGQVMLLHAWFSATEWITDLFTAPRLIEPIWLALSCGYSNDPSSLAHSFMNELCWLLNSADTKDTNFFVSKLLTAILTHHLGWVCTVAPISNYSTSSKNVAEAIAKEEKDKMSEISKYHPYNALWAQMGDLYGAIGSPPKISKTIVCGNETKFVEKVLNVLTYFIRCGEIRRDVRTEIFEKTVVDGIVNKYANNPVVDVNSIVDSVTLCKSSILKKATGLTRAPTCIKDLTALSDNSLSEANANQAINSSLTSAFKKNDIPNVLIFRESRIVRQELRIGNFLMDTGIEMNTKQKLDMQNYQARGQLGEHIKLLVTSPDNEEINVGSLDEYSTESEDTVEEATECLVGVTPTPQVSIIGPTLSDMITANSIGQGRNPSTFLWGVEPVKEGLSVEQWQNIEKGMEMRNGNCLSDGKLDIFSVYNKEQDVPELKRSKSLYTKSTNAKNSDRVRKQKLIRKASFSFVDCQNEEHNEPSELKSHPSLSDLITANSVGVSERLTWGIEPYKEAVSLEEEQHFEIAKKRIENTRRQSGVVFVLGDNDKLIGLKNNGSSEMKKSETETKIERSLSMKKTCSHKKHSGVKFNFEQYPQIATNYMKNKNIDIANYDFIDKGLKLEEGSNLIYGPSTSNFPSSTSEDDNTECEYCAGNTSRILQTPSNATELEFSVDDNNYLPFMDTKKASDATSSSSSPSPSKETKSKMKTVDDKLQSSKQIQLIELPMPQYTVLKDENDHAKQSQHRPGFIPSLFIGVTDHYISDMVLQGTIAPPAKWESKLKNHLALASRCAMIEQTPTENIAIIANIDKWDVKLMSSQTTVLPNTNGSCIGMSQLVSSMLETVHAMWTSGINAYQCMSYIESKLQELYLQSETLAAFLLATNFCNLETITSALNITEYDVPLLMSVASCHTPQLTEKYTCSFGR
ncbi:hypothetical protein HA402_016182 [Bradysia odoriphaga]|nr:hypothetical protein HA402_016182 [Bradysia odoriphaga]